jgi:hypothetical protein
MLRISATKGLMAGKFRHGKIFVTEERWTNVDASDKEVRASLIQFVPSHIRLYEGQEKVLAELGLELKGGKLVDLRAAAAAEKAKPAAPKEQPKEARPAR